MPQRTFWKGYLKLSLVTCPVELMPATSDSAKVRFHVVNRATGNRIQSRYVDAVTGKPVAEEDEVKGYPRGENDFVTLEDEELDAVALESTRTIDIDKFVPRESIEWIWYDTPHFLLPGDKMGEEAYSVIRDAMKAAGMVGIARLVLYRRERAVMLEPRDKGIVLWTLHYGDEVRDQEATLADRKEDTPDPKLAELVQALIKERIKPWSADMMQDPVQDVLTDIIAAKQKGTKRAKAKAPAAKPDNVVNLMDALRKSLGGSPRR
jgi:DNA end-binding protein Ku